MLQTIVDVINTIKSKSIYDLVCVFDFSFGWKKRGAIHNARTSGRSIGGLAIARLSGEFLRLRFQESAMRSTTAQLKAILDSIAGASLCVP